MSTNMSAGPKRLHVDREAPELEDLAEAVRILKRGGVVAYPTETFYGLAASAFDPGGCGRIFEIKGRPAFRALPCILSGREQLSMVSSDTSPLVSRLAELFWPGPLTLVVRARAAVVASSEEGTVAVRVSSHAIARALAAAAGPVTSTSANRSGGLEATTAAEVEAELGDVVDVVVDGGPTAGGRASTIVDVTQNAPKLIREGRVRFRDVLVALETS